VSAPAPAMISARTRLEGALLGVLARLPEPVLRALAGRPDVADGRRLDPLVQLGLRLQRLSGAPAFESLEPSAARAEMRRTVGTFRAGPPVTLARISDVSVPGAAGPLAARLYEPTLAAGPRPVLLYFHGGGFVIGDLDTHDDACRLLARRSGVAVLAVDYRLAPETPFPGAFDDALAVLRWAVGPDSGFDPRRVAMGGDSAGGNLTAVVSLACRDAGEPGPAFQLLFYPLVDPSERPPSYARFGSGYALDVSLIDYFTAAYPGPHGALDDPRIAPLRAASVAGIAPTWLATAGFDPLRDEGFAWARRLREAGVPVTHVDHSGLIHGYVNLVGGVPAARAAVEQGADALRQALGCQDAAQLGIPKAPPRSSARW